MKERQIHYRYRGSCVCGNEISAIIQKHVTTNRSNEWVRCSECSQISICEPKGEAD